ncbi:MAG TPA: sigma-70 family RNA polymerase sigma factor [Bacteroidota bacterium]|nr:sigma-70 family RNA polymerase sigma factor [Bacteroidota bacterium]
MQTDGLLPHLFRTEYARIVNVLCRRFGFDHIESAEDITSDTFLAAAELWSVEGNPENPRAWLYAVAKNKALNFLKRERLFRETLAPALRAEETDGDEPEIDLSDANIRDSQLRMMFAICHPSIPPEAQVGLSLRILCGFGIDEIAGAFLSNRETINKRLFRAKESLRARQEPPGMPPAGELTERLEAVLATIYLLFNEGYYSARGPATIRKDLCVEAMRLAHMLTEDERTNTPAVHALLSLMCFHASRFDARTDANGEVILYDDQDRSLWDGDLINRGEQELISAATGERLSRYHIEAAIAYWHTRVEEKEEKWAHIVELYDQLLAVADSPMAALNRIYALGRARGAAEAIPEAELLGMEGDKYYHLLLGELYTGVDRKKAALHFRRAECLTNTPSEKHVIALKLARLAGAAERATRAADHATGAANRATGATEGVTPPPAAPGGRVSS